MNAVRVDRRIVLGLSAALALLLICGVLSYETTLRWMHSYRTVTHTHAVISLEQELLASLAQAENGLFGYIITGQQSSLAPYFAATNRIDQLLRELRREQLPEPSHQRFLDRLEPLIAQRLALIPQHLQAPNVPAPPASPLAHRQEVDQLMQAVRQVLAEMRSEEQRLLREGEQRAASGAVRTLYLDVAFGVLSLLLIGTILVWLVRENLRRRRSEQSLREARDALEVRVRERTADLAQANQALHTEIDDHKRAELALRASEEKLAGLAGELAEKNHELEMLVYVASHDLRSPVVNIHGFSQELAHATEQLRSRLAALGETPLKAELDKILDQDFAEALGYISASVHKIDVLLAGLLRFSRLGREALHLETLDMHQLLSELAQTMEFQLHQAGATLQLGRLPRCIGDATQIGQVFSNLLDNALKYRHPQRPPVIAVSGHLDQGRAIYAVRDNGTGIAPEHQKKIFEIFQRLEPARSPGEGLGLTIAQRILERQQGKIWVESNPGQGSVFFLSLPAGP